MDAPRAEINTMQRAQELLIDDTESMRNGTLDALKSKHGSTMAIDKVQRDSQQIKS